MDPDRFDTLARSFGGARSRRGFARFLGGLSLGGALAAFGIDAALAGTRIGGAPCTEDSQCQTNTCLRNLTCSCSSEHLACKQPRNPCRRAKCNVTVQRCVTKNKPTGAVCPADPDDEGNPCTDYECDGTGRCMRKANEGAPCPGDDGNPCTDHVCNAAGECARQDKNDFVTCPEGLCIDGSCVACTHIGDPCDDAAECCHAGGDYVACRRGDGGVCGSSFFKSCCSGYGGPCESRCDCCEGADCVQGTCGCPQASPQRTCPLGGGQCLCCPVGWRVVCQPFGSCFCQP